MLERQASKTLRHVLRNQGSLAKGLTTEFAQEVQMFLVQNVNSRVLLAFTRDKETTVSRGEDDVFLSHKLSLVLSLVIMRIRSEEIK